MNAREEILAATLIDEGWGQGRGHGVFCQVLLGGLPEEEMRNESEIMDHVVIWGKSISGQREQQTQRSCPDKERVKADTHSPI